MGFGNAAAPDPGEEFDHNWSKAWERGEAKRRAGEPPYSDDKKMESLPRGGDGPSGGGCAFGGAVLLLSALLPLIYAVKELV